MDLAKIKADAESVKSQAVPGGVLELLANHCLALAAALEKYESRDASVSDLIRTALGIQCSAKDSKLLELLLKRPGEVISRDQILNSVWGEEVYVTHRTVDSHVATLRKKIEAEPDRPQYILTVRGVGYKLNENPTHS